MRGASTALERRAEHRSPRRRSANSRSNACSRSALARPQDEHAASRATLVELGRNARHAGVVFDARELRRLQTLQIIAELAARTDCLKEQRTVHVDVHRAVSVR